MQSSSLVLYFLTALLLEKETIMEVLVSILCLIFLMFWRVMGQCTYHTAIAKCYCEAALTITEDIVLAELESETCDCIVKFSYDIRVVTNIYDRSCRWDCANKTCS